MRLSSKTIVPRQFPYRTGMSTDFDKNEFTASLKTKGYNVIHEKAYLCPCKSQGTPASLSTCKNCGGTGWMFANPTKTRMVITGIMLDDKLKEGPMREWGQLDKGACKITCLDNDKLSYMDRLVNLDATAEHDQILYPKLDDEDTQLFAFTKYDIKGIDFVGMYRGADQPIERLTEFDDYTYSDNILILNSKYNDLSNPQVTIRYVHNPEYHVIDILRESITQYENQGKDKQILHLHAVAMRAHLISDAENFDGDRLFDNSWKHLACDAQPNVDGFLRKLKYSSVDYIYNNMTSVQQSALIDLICDSN